MSRSIEPKCWECSQLDSTTARQLHGEQGDGCWNEKICHRRRSHYRHRADNNQKRKGQYAINKAATTQQVDSISVRPKVPPVAILYLYRESRKDAHLHAVSITVWQGDQKLKQIGPTHCMGMTNSQVRQYLIEVLKILQEQHGIREFEPEIYVSPQFCPLLPCPLKPLT